MASSDQLESPSNSQRRGGSDYGPSQDIRENDPPPQYVISINVDELPGAAAVAAIAPTTTTTFARGPSNNSPSGQYQYTPPTVQQQQAGWPMYPYYNTPYTYMPNISMYNPYMSVAPPPGYSLVAPNGSVSTTPPTSDSRSKTTSALNPDSAPFVSSHVERPPGLNVVANGASSVEMARISPGSGKPESPNTWTDIVSLDMVPPHATAQPASAGGPSSSVSSLNALVPPNANANVNAVSASSLAPKTRARTPSDPAQSSNLLLPPPSSSSSSSAAHGRVSPRPSTPKKTRRDPVAFHSPFAGMTVTNVVPVEGKQPLEGSENPTREGNETERASASVVDGQDKDGDAAADDDDDDEKAEKIEFQTGNPRVEVSTGSMHLFRAHPDAKSRVSMVDRRSDVVAILAVPVRMTVPDLLGFLSDYLPVIQHMRLVRDPSPSKYMVLIKFVDQSSADGFYEQYNGELFNPLDPERAHVLFVADVEFLKEPKGSLPGAASGWADAPAAAANDDTLLELPTCPVCLDRLDASVSGVLTISCNHSFHCNCLAKWSDTTCPVCRYCQDPSAQSTPCMECGAGESLWICLLCGHVGCGRYESRHAYGHYVETGHAYTMEIDSQRVWDYAGDGYVHRIVQDKVDGKLVELPDPTTTPGKSGSRRMSMGAGVGGGDSGGGYDDGFDGAAMESKMENIALEYNYLLTSQLETQRKWYEDRLASTEAEQVEFISGLQDRLRVAESEAGLHADKLKELEKDRKALSKKAASATSRMANAESEHATLVEINKALMGSVRDLRGRIKEVEAAAKNKEKAQNARIADLEEQVKDLMFFLEAQKTIAKAEPSVQADVLGGAVTVGDAPEPKPTPAEALAAKRRGKRGARR